MNIVQIGTNHGLDHVRDFVKENDCDFILLVEPWDVHNKYIIKSYNNIKNYLIENVAIDPNITDNSIISKPFYISKRDGPRPECRWQSYQCSSLKEEHLLKCNLNQIKTIEVPCISINYLFTKHQLYHIDYLFIDAEGYDFEILQSIDFTQFDITNIQIEILHLNKSKLYAYMDDKNYSRVLKKTDANGYDFLFRKN